MSDSDGPKIGEALARIEANQNAVRQTMEDRFTDVLARLGANERQNEQANTFAREGIGRVENRLDAFSHVLEGERSRIDFAITAVRRDLNRRIDGVELQTATRTAIIEDRVEDLEDQDAKRTWAAGLARPIVTLAYGGLAAAVGILVDRLLG